MIDWIKAVIPCAHTDQICGGLVVSLNATSGEIEWQSLKRLVVEGSHSARVQVKTHAPNYLLVDGNPSKFLQGHNLFGTNDLVGLCNTFFERISKVINLNPTESDMEAWRRGEFKLKRVDVTESFRLRCQDDVAAWLRAATPLARGKHQPVSAYGSETIYLGQNSRRISLKLYNKWRELQKHPLPVTLPFRNALEKHAKPLLRLEVRLLGMELKRRGLESGKDWAFDGTTQNLIWERIGSLKMTQKLRLTAHELDSIPPRLVAVYKLWQQGEDVRNLFPKATFYRYRSELLQHGIDISNLQPKKAEVIPLLHFLTAEHVPSIPDWAIGTELYYDPPEAVRTKRRPMKRVK